MRSRNLHTKSAIIVTNYTIAQQTSGQYLHTFTPGSTDTLYHFLDGKSPRLEEGHVYNFGHEVFNGEYWIDISSIAKADEVNPSASHRFARQVGEKNRAAETRKSDDRITHSATDGKYLGKKYAWRIYGLAFPKDVFYAYLEVINHPSTACVTNGSPSVAYKDKGIDIAMDTLVRSCINIRNNRFKSNLLLNKAWFSVNGIEAITDKK